MFKRKNVVIILMFGLFLLCLFVINDTFVFKDNLLHIYVFDVGQGDGIFIKSPKGKTILIDGGPDGGIIYDLSHRLPFYKREIDIAIVSHPHADHISGLIEILKRYSIGKLFLDTHNYSSIEVSLIEEKVRILDIDNNIMIHNGIYEIDEITLHILWPPQAYECQNVNDCSVVMKLSYKDFCMYFMGDATNEVQERIAFKNNLTSCPVIKVAHQGAKDSVNKSFLIETTPEIGVISVGQNSYGHPAAEALSMLESLGIKTFRTDLEGDIEIVTNGQQWSSY